MKKKSPFNDHSKLFNSFKAGVLDRISMGDIGRALFHDLTLDTFPLLLHYWRDFCDKRYRYVARKEILKFRRNRNLRQTKFQCDTKLLPKIDTLSAKPLVDYKSGKRFKGVYVDINKSLGNNKINSKTLFRHIFR